MTQAEPAVPEGLCNLHNAKHMLLHGCLALLFACHISGRAQSPPCGLSSMSNSRPPVYLPLAKAAHVIGPVIFMVQFALDGSVVRIDVLSGPEILKASAVEFVKDWKANPYTGPRTCPIVVNYVLDNGSGNSPKQGFSDVQHFTVVAAAPPCLCDPAIDRRRKLFGIF